MPINILMPALSPTMTEGTVAKWLMKEGDEVKAGDVLAEIETDKATMEVEAVDEGTLGKIVVPEGTEGVPVNDVIAVLLEEGEDKTAITAAPVKAPAKPAPQTPAPSPAPAAQAATPAAVAPVRMEGERIAVSPLARRMAQQAGLDLAAIRGSGPNGRVVKRDIESALSGASPTARAPAVAPAPAPAAAGPGAKTLADLLGMTYRQEPNTGVRKTIARRLTEAKQTVPHFYLTVDCRIDELLRVRKEINGRFDDLKISVNDFVIRAAALALTQVPAANASWDDSGVLLYEHADVSVAVATPNGLITPIIKAAEGKGLAIISREMKDLAGRARE
ncbi:MAG: 2-oxo acid dehydrogenase subunit E2, partial [Alphaproteobacteria bacterium]